MWRFRFGLALAWLLIPGVIMAQECPLTAPLTLKDTQDGVVGPTGTAWTILPDCSFTIARQIGLKTADPHKRGRLTPEQQKRLEETMARTAAAADLPEHVGSFPQVNARRITLSYAGRTSVLTLPPGGGDLAALRSAAGNGPAAQMLELADMVKGMTGG